MSGAKKHSGQICGAHSGFQSTFPPGRFLSQPLKTWCSDFTELRNFLSNCKYVSDQEQFGEEDYWQPPDDFEQLKKGERYRALRQGGLIPVKTLISVTQRSPFYHDEQKAQLFYAEAWALVHYCLFGPNMDGGAKMNAFYLKLQNGEEQNQAFEEVCGSFKPMDQGVSEYVHLNAFTPGW